MAKFDRNFELLVQTNDGGQITVKMPFTVEFDITRNTLTSANVCQIRVYNLSEKNRSLVRKDVTDYADLRQIQLKAGYGDNLPVIFSGNITQAWSVREGTNFITQFECFDAGYAFVNAQLPPNSYIAGTPLTTILTDMAQNLPNVKVGKIGNFTGSIQRGNSYSGSIVDNLRQLTGGGFFIDNGVINFLKDNECIEGEINLINSDMGLLNTPIREQTILTFDILFEPRLLIGQKIELQSLTNKNYNGFYKITGIKHRGIISGAVSGEAITTATMLYGTGLTVV